MTGIAALAAAAAATQKIQGASQTTTTPVSGIKVVTPTIVTPQGVKVTPVTTRQIGMYSLLPGLQQSGKKIWKMKKIPGRGKDL